MKNNIFNFSKTFFLILSVLSFLVFSVSAQDCGQADFSYTLDGNIVRLLGKSSLGDTAKYYWTFGNGASSEGRETKYQYEKSGEYQICLKVNIASCTSAKCKSIKIEPTVPGGCSLKVDYDFKVDGNTSFFYAKSNDEKAMYYWIVSGQNKTYEGKETKIPFEKEGYYEVCLIGVDGAQTCKVQTCKKIEISKTCSLGADFTYTIDSNNVVKVLGKSAAGDTAKYHWTFGNGKSGEGREFKYQYEKPGEYEICLKVVKWSVTANANHSCTQSICKKVKAGSTISIDCSLKIEFDFRVDGNTVVLMAKSNDDKSKFYWYVTGQNKQYEGRETKIPFEKNGVYEICLTGVNGLGNCKVQTCRKVEIVNICTLGADFTYTIDSNNVVRVLGKSTVGDTVKYYWTFGNSKSGEGREFKYHYEKPGEYELCLKVVKGHVTNSSTQPCTQSICKRIKINPISDKDCNLKVEIEHRVEGSIGIFIAKSNSDAAKYLWFVGGQNKQYEGREVKIPFEKSGVYEVCVKAFTTENCKVQVCKRIEIGFPCTLGADFTYTIDSNNVVRVLGKSTAGDTVKYYWTFGNGTSGEGRESKSQYEKLGEYEICLKVVKGHVTNSSTLPCTQSICKRIKINPISDKDCNLKVEIEHRVEGSIGIFIAKSNSDAAKYLWFVAGQDKQYEGREVKIPFEKSGVYEVCVKAFTTENCKVQVCKRIEIGVLCNLGADFTYTVEKDIVKVKATSTAGDTAKYYWTFSNGISVEGREAIFKFDKPGEYQMCLKVIKGSITSSAVQPCIQTVCKKIQVSSETECKLAPDFTYKSEGSTVIFTGTSTDEKAKYYWYGKDIKIDLTGKVVRFQFEKAASYEVCMVVVNGTETCKDQICKKITVGNRINVFPNPTANVLNIVVDEDISRVTIYDQFNKVVHTGNLTDSYENIDISHLNNGLYSITVQLNNGEVMSKRFYKQ